MDWMETEELAIVALGLNEDDDPDSDTIEQSMFDKFEISLEQFQAVAEALMPLTIPAKAAISGEAFNGFVKDGAFIVKAPVVPNAGNERTAD